MYQWVKLASIFQDNVALNDLGVSLPASGKNQSRLNMELRDRGCWTQHSQSAESTPRQTGRKSQLFITITSKRCVNRRSSADEVELPTRRQCVVRSASADQYVDRDSLSFDDDIICCAGMSNGGREEKEEDEVKDIYQKTGPPGRVVSSCKPPSLQHLGDFSSWQTQGKEMEESHHSADSISLNMECDIEPYDGDSVEDTLPTASSVRVSQPCQDTMEVIQPECIVMDKDEDLGEREEIQGHISPGPTLIDANCYFDEDEDCDSFLELEKACGRDSFVEKENIKNKSGSSDSIDLNYTSDCKDNFADVSKTGKCQTIYSSGDVINHNSTHEQFPDNLPNGPTDKGDWDIKHSNHRGSVSGSAKPDFDSEQTVECTLEEDRLPEVTPEQFQSDWGILPSVKSELQPLNGLTKKVSMCVFKFTQGVSLYLIVGLI